MKPVADRIYSKENFCWVRAVLPSTTLISLILVLFLSSQAYASKLYLEGIPFRAIRGSLTWSLMDCSSCPDIRLFHENGPINIFLKKDPLLLEFWCDWCSTCKPQWSSEHSCFCIAKMLCLTRNKIIILYVNQNSSFRFKSHSHKITINTLFSIHFTREKHNSSEFLALPAPRASGIPPNHNIHLWGRCQAAEITVLSFSLHQM